MYFDVNFEENRENDNKSDNRIEENKKPQGIQGELQPLLDKLT